MNIFKKLASLLSTGEQEPEVSKCKDQSCGDVLGRMLREAGVKKREMDKVNLIDDFEEWYNGDCDEESIKNSLEEFKKIHPAANAKLTGKI